MNLKIGQDIKFVPDIGENEEGTKKRKEVTGKIIYIHPQNRYVVAEYSITDIFGQTSLLKQCIEIRYGILMRNPYSIAECTKIADKLLGTIRKEGRSRKPECKM